MLAKVVRSTLQVTLHLDVVSRSLVHQLQSMLLRLFHRHEALRWVVLVISIPVSLLRRYVGGRDDAFVRINKPQSQESSVARLGRVFEPKRRNSMLAKGGQNVASIR